VFVRLLSHLADVHTHSVVGTFTRVLEELHTSQRHRLKFSYPPYT